MCRGLHENFKMRVPSPWSPLSTKLGNTRDHRVFLGIHTEGPAISINQAARPLTAECTVTNPRSTLCTTVDKIYRCCPVSVSRLRPGNRKWVSHTITLGWCDKWKIWTMERKNETFLTSSDGQQLNKVNIYSSDNTHQTAADQKILHTRVKIRTRASHIRSSALFSCHSMQVR